jgi:GNAT superfamily N-acetyltransferase
MNEPIVLQDASPEQLVQATAHNHRELFCISALAVGGEVRATDGVTWTYAGSNGASMIAFPALTADRAGAQLDEIVDYYLHHSSPKLVGCWSLEPPQPHDLGARLLARGFQPNWRPCWMALDLDRMQTGHPQPPELAVEADNETDLRDVKRLPYNHTDDGRSPLELAQRYRDRLGRFVAKLGGNVVGQSVVFLTSGPDGVAGIYDVGVVPEVRNQGIGKAVVSAACLYARERGYRYAVLNATGRRMYEQLGFQWMGDGWTWWLNIPRLAAYPAHSRTPERIAFSEAVGRGDVAALNSLGAYIDGGELNVPLANEMTLVQLAGHLRQPASAEWLVAHGATLDVLSAWDLGWQERAARLLADDPNLVNQRYGEWKLTLLHEAASRGDVALARLALSANPDLTVKDQAFQSTPLGWARHFARVEIIRLIEEHSAGSSG